MHLFCFFQLLPCFVLLFYHSGLIIICNTVIFPVLEQGILSKKERQTNKKKICFSTCDGFPLDELCRYDWTELFIEPYLVSLSFLHISFSPTLQSVYHLAMGLDYLFLKSLPEGFPIRTPNWRKGSLWIDLPKVNLQLSYLVVPEIWMNCHSWGGNVKPEVNI